MGIWYLDYSYLKKMPWKCHFEHLRSGQSTKCCLIADKDWKRKNRLEIVIDQQEAS